MRAEVGGHLVALVRKEFVRPDRAQLSGDDGYRFAHALVRDAAYQSISKKLRAELHERLVAWFERVAPDRLGEFEEVLAYHLEQAARYRAALELADEGGSGRRAAVLLARSGTRAYDRGDLSAADNLLGRAVALLPVGDPLRVRALPMLGAAILDAAGGMERALGLLSQALEESRATGDRAAEAGAWALHSVVRIHSDPDTDVEELGRHVEARAPEIERLGDLRALVWLRRLELDVALTRADGIEAAAAKLLAAARRTGDRSNGLAALFFVCASGVLGSMPVDEALAASRSRLRPLAEGPVEEATVEHLEGLLRGMRGEFDQGLRTIRKTRAAFAEFGLRLTAVSTSRDEALIARYAGDPAEAEHVLRSACDELRTAGETAVLSLEIGELGDALYELGRYHEADEAARESATLAQDADVFAQVVWRRVRAKLLARAGESDEAVQLIRDAIARAGTRPEQLGDAYRDLGEIEQITGRPNEAKEALEAAIAAYELKGMLPMSQRTRRELLDLRAGPPQASGI